MSIIRVNQLPEGSGNLTNDDIFIFMDDPSGSGITKKISLSQISDNIVAKVVDFAPETLNTLNELAAALGDNADFFNDVAYSGDNISKFVNDIGYSVSGHTHTASNITNFNSSVSGLLPVKNVTGSGYVSVSPVSGVYEVSVSGLQPSGNYAASSHTHTSSNVTDFNSSVSGLLPTIANTGSGDNRLLTSTGSSVGINAENNLTFNGSLLNVNGSGNFSSGVYVNSSGVSLIGHTHTASNITDFNSSVSGLLPSKYPTVVQLGSVSGTINTNASLGDIFDLTLASSGTLANPSGSVDGQTLRWRISHNANSLVLNFGNQFKIPSSATSPLPLSSTSGNMDILGATYDSSRSKWDIIAFVPGY